MRSLASYYVGCITGTSVDGLDLALLRLHAKAQGSEIETCAHATIDIPAALRQELLALGQPGDNEIDRLGAADAALGLFIAEQVNQFLAQQKIAAVEVTAIGSHGQTVRHRPPDQLRSEHSTTRAFTLQIGDPNQIAEHTGITTVADFRRRDMAAGGEGAPLVPLFHQALLGSSNQTQALLNIGGLANLTGIPAASQPDQALIGFDTGPGNGLMDAWIMRHQNQAYDADGLWAAQGTVNAALLERMLGDAYFDRKPPKSTGKEYFNLPWLEEQLAAQFEDQSNRNRTLAPEDVQATLLELTVSSIARAIGELENRFERVLVCGGGRLNGQLMLRLANVLATQNIEVGTTDAIGVDGDSLEAAAFAWLACQTLAGLPGNEPSVTGAKGPRVLGAIYPA